MKKILMFILTVVLISFSALGFAAKPDTCALLIADTDMKAEDYINKVKECFQNNPNVDYGTHIQIKYQEYWFNKGELEEGKATPEVLFEFRKFSGFDKCLYLVTEKSIEKSIQPAFLTRVEKTRASVNVKGYLVGLGNDGTDKVLKLFNVVSSADSDTSDLRAKRSAFEKAMKELVKQYNEYLRQNK
ncbi:MAG: hypothetical protein J6M57_07555 [Acidaminococcaceae bacterium]|nr:hypothetical protein [Acidaminococcaceae bacterium]